MNITFRPVHYLQIFGPCMVLRSIISTVASSDTKTLYFQYTGRCFKLSYIRILVCSYRSVPGPCHTTLISPSTPAFFACCELGAMDHRRRGPCIATWTRILLCHISAAAVGLATTGGMASSVLYEAFDMFWPRERPHSTLIGQGADVVSTVSAGSRAGGIYTRRGTQELQEWEESWGNDTTMVSPTTPMRVAKATLDQADRQPCTAAEVPLRCTSKPWNCKKDHQWAT